MRITKRQLRRIIKEEAADCLKDYRLGGLSYQEYRDCLKRFGDIESQGGGYGGGGSRYPRYQRKTSYVGVEANQEQIAAVENALAAKPNNFLSSILTQLQGGRGLSGKQKSIVKRIISKHDPGAAQLFERREMRITKRQLRRIVREAINEAEFYDETPEGQLVGTEAEDARFNQQVADEKLAKATAQQAELMDMIEAILGDNPGMGGMDVVGAIQYQPAFRGAKKSHVFDALEVMVEEDRAFFNVEDDEWWLPNDWELYQTEGGVWSDERDYEAGFMS